MDNLILIAVLDEFGNRLNQELTALEEKLPDSLREEIPVVWPGFPKREPTTYYPIVAELWELRSDIDTFIFNLKGEL